MKHFLKRAALPALLIICTASIAAGFDVTDSLGRQVSFDRQPERIVLAGRALLMMADAVYMYPEARDKVIALENRLQGPNNFIAVVDKNSGSKMTLPKDVGAEQIAALRPDLVLLKTYMRQKLGQPLERLGFNVVYLDFESPEEYLQEIKMLGKLLGNESRGREITAFYRERMEEIANLTDKIPRSLSPSILFLSYSDRGGAVSFSVPPRSWMQSKLIEHVGGNPVWESDAMQKGWQTVGFEQIARWNPEVIIVTSYFSHIDEVIADLQSDPLWKSLDAVKYGEVYGVPADYLSWDQPDTRWILFFQWCAQVVWPDYYEDFDMMGEVYTFYEEMYDIGPRRFDAEVAPLLRGDIFIYD